MNVFGSKELVEDVQKKRPLHRMRRLRGPVPVFQESQGQDVHAVPLHA